ncbi:cyclic GMP-AMP synthase DncV-like nucleotidyltransferase [Xanthomonas arboricola]|uniref:cyclic GMP-AMP synthase DncV-like nucleotidyltransferase n=1 Tax=Xanthomonas arboricola TaxID=56448 RepID=UPI0035B55C45
MASAVALFHSTNSEAETINCQIRPGDSQREYLLEHKNELAKWLTSDLGDLGMQVSTFIQGSYKFHTLIRPLKTNDEYDVDLGLYFKGKPHANIDPAELRETVQRSLLRFGAESDGACSLRAFVCSHAAEYSRS